MERANAALSGVSLGSPGPPTSWPRKAPTWVFTISTVVVTGSGDATQLFPYDGGGVGKWEWRKLLQHEEVISGIPSSRFTLLYTLGEQKGCGESLNCPGVDQILGGFRTASPLTCEGAGGRGVGGAGEL